MATEKGLEPTTSAVPGRRSNHLRYTAILSEHRSVRFHVIGGNNRARTYDPLLVRQMLSQLSYASISRHNRDDLHIIAHQKAFVNRFLKIFLIFFDFLKFYKKTAKSASSPSHQVNPFDIVY